MLLSKQLMVAIDLVFFSILCKSMATINLMVSKYDTEYFRLNDPLKSTWNQNWSYLSIMPNLHRKGDIDALLKWHLHKQMLFRGGINAFPQQLQLCSLMPWAEMGPKRHNLVWLLCSITFSHNFEQSQSSRNSAVQRCLCVWFNSTHYYKWK